MYKRQQGTEADAPTANAGITLTLRAAEHPELDFGMAGEQRALMDFAVGTDGLVYLLGQDGQILAYRADGTLAAEYDLALRQQGLTACRIAAGEGVLYLLDGHNNVILTVEQGKIKRLPLTGQVAAISAGIVGGVPMLDLDYPEDSHADVDLNLIGTDAGGIVEIQGTGEHSTLSRAQLNDLLDMAEPAIARLCSLQNEVTGFRS